MYCRKKIGYQFVFKQKPQRYPQLLRKSQRSRKRTFLKLLPLVLLAQFSCCIVKRDANFLESNRITAKSKIRDNDTPNLDQIIESIEKGIQTEQAGYILLDLCGLTKEDAILLQTKYYEKHKKHLTEELKTYFEKKNIFLALLAKAYLNDKVYLRNHLKPCYFDVTQFSNTHDKSLAKDLNTKIKKLESLTYEDFLTEAANGNQLFLDRMSQSKVFLSLFLWVKGNLLSIYREAVMESKISGKINSQVIDTCLSTLDTMSGYSAWAYQNLSHDVVLSGLGFQPGDKWKLGLAYLTNQKPSGFKETLKRLKCL